MKIEKVNGHFLLSTVFMEFIKRCEGGYGTSARAMDEKAQKIRLSIGNIFQAHCINCIRDDCYSVSGYLKDSEQIHPEYLAWLDQVREIVADPNLWAPVPPQFDDEPFTLRPWQVLPYRWAMTMKKVGLALTLGAGKTFVAGKVLNDLARQAKKDKKPFRALWVTKKEGDLHTQTYEELKFKFKFKHIIPLFLKGNSLKDKADNVEFEDVDGIVYMCNYEMFRPEAGNRGNSLIDAFLELSRINGHVFNAVVFDESSNLRNHTEHLRGLVYFRGGHWPTYSEQPTYRLAEYLIELSGDPAPQSPSDWAHQDNMIHPIMLPWNTVNAMKKVGSYMNPFTKQITWITSFLEKLHRRNRQFWYVLSKKDAEEQGLNIPVNVKLVKVKMTQVQRRMYEEMSDEMITTMDQAKKRIESKFSKLMDGLWGDELKKVETARKKELMVEANNVLAQMTRLRQITGCFCGGLVEVEEEGEWDDFDEEEDLSKKPVRILAPIPGKNPKLEKLIELVNQDENKEQIEEPQPDGTVKITSKIRPFIVFATFRHEIQIIHERLAQLNLKGGTIRGGQGSKNRETRQKFQGGEYDYAVINPASGKFGGNYQRASEAYYFSNSPKGEERNQSMGRLARDGQLRNVTVYDIACEGSVDLTTLHTLRKKKSIADLVLFKLPDLLSGKLTEEEENELQGYIED